MKGLYTIKAGDKYRIGDHIIVAITEVVATRFGDSDKMEAWVYFTWHQEQTGVTRERQYTSADNLISQVTGRIDELEAEAQG